MFNPFVVVTSLIADLLIITDEKIGGKNKIQYKKRISKPNYIFSDVDEVEIMSIERSLRDLNAKIHKLKFKYTEMDQSEMIYEIFMMHYENYIKQYPYKEKSYLLLIGFGNLNFIIRVIENVSKILFKKLENKEYDDEKEKEQIEERYKEFKRKTEEAKRKRAEYIDFLKKLKLYEYVMREFE